MEEEEEEEQEQEQEQEQEEEEEEERVAQALEGAAQFVAEAVRAGGCVLLHAGHAHEAARAAAIEARTAPSSTHGLPAAPAPRPRPRLVGGYGVRER